MFLRHLVAERTRELNLLNDLAELLQSCQSEEEARDIIGNLGGRLFPGARGALFLLAAGRDRLEAAAAWGGAPAPASFPPDDCWALRRGCPHEVWPGSHEPPCRHFGKSPEAAICLPLMAQGETIGILCLKAVLAETQRRLARSAAHQCALALANLRLRETLKRQSIRDPLTGLFNRRHAEEMLARELELAARNRLRLGLMMIDVDGFKQVNDAGGHEGGDTLMRDLGALLKARVRETDIPCRYGGDEFLVILPGASLEETRRRAEELCAQVRSFPFAHHGRPLGRVTLSVGIASYPGHAQSLDALVRAADTALYKAKEAGRDRVEAPVLAVPWTPPAGRVTPAGRERLHEQDPSFSGE